MNSYDIDGVIYMGKGLKGLVPRDEDVIITGRSYQERGETICQLSQLGVMNLGSRLYMAPWRWEHKTRHRSGLHKAVTLTALLFQGNKIDIHFEDDEIQADIIRLAVPDVHVVLIQHNLVDKENVRHTV